MVLGSLLFHPPFFYLKISPPGRNPFPYLKRKYDRDDNILMAPGSGLEFMMKIAPQWTTTDKLILGCCVPEFTV
jgi:hypothetical protein